MKRTVPYAFYTAGALIAYFFLMKIFGLEKNFYLRIFNLFIIGAGIFFLYRNSLVRDKEERSGYLQSLFSGALLTIVTIVIFAVFLGLYIQFLDPELLNAISSGLWPGIAGSVTQEVLVILMEGLASGFIISFILMQYFKSAISSRDSV